MGHVKLAGVGTRRAWSAALRRLVGRVGVVSVVLALVAAVPGSAVAATMPPAISTSFGAASIPLKGSTSLSFSIGNPNFGTGLAGIGFSDDLPVGLVVATPNVQSGDCGGTVTAAAGSSNVSLSGGSLSPGSQCAISVNVNGTWGGQKHNSVTVSTGSGLTGNTSTAGVTVTVPARERVYWTHDNSISFVNLDGSGGGDLTTTGATVNDPEGVALDPAAGKIYWANHGNSSISYANLDGSGGGDLNTTGATVSYPIGVALDPAAGKIYWANIIANKISYANLDGSGGGDLVTTGAAVQEPEGVALDPAAGKIYWANTGGKSISYANLNGTGGSNLNTIGATVNQPLGVALDPAAGTIYWLNFANSISYANLNGTGGRDLITKQVEAWGVALDPAAGRIYWADANGSNSISYADLDDVGGGNLAVPYHENHFLALLKLPAAVGAPAVTRSGSVLSCSRGAWAADLVGSFLYRAPRSFAYRWSRAMASGCCVSQALRMPITSSASTLSRQTMKMMLPDMFRARSFDNLLGDDLRVLRHRLVIFVEISVFPGLQRPEVDRHRFAGADDLLLAQVLALELSRRLARVLDLELERLFGRDFERIGCQHAVLHLQLDGGVLRRCRRRHEGQRNRCQGESEKRGRGSEHRERSLSVGFGCRDATVSVTISHFAIIFASFVASG